MIASLAPRLLIAMLVAGCLSAATVDGLKVHFTATGDGARTVILVHGWTCDESVWSEQASALARHYRVVTLDLPGHGQTASPEDGNFSMDLFARAVEAVRAEVNAGRVVLVGHSMGTPVILRYARLYPRHTAALVFVDGPIFPPVSPDAQTRPGPPFGARFGGPDGLKNREEFIRGLFSDATTPAMRTKILHLMLSAPEATAVGAMNAMFSPAGRTGDIAPVPILGIYAAQPAATSQAVHARFPAAEYRQIPGAGHFLMMEKADEFNRLLLAFLDRNGG